MKFISKEFVHKDNRRTLSQLLTQDIKQVNHYDTHKGAFLGDHYHKQTYEYFLITKGSFLVDIKGKRQVVGRQDFFVVEPGEKHVLECLSLTGSFLTFLTKPYTKEETDTYR